MSRRFDRKGHDVKHHVQSFFALKHFDFDLLNSFSFEQLFQCMRELRLSYADSELRSKELKGQTVKKVSQNFHFSVPKPIIGR